MALQFFRFLLLPVLSILVFACRETETLVIDAGFDYYPLEIGQQRIYRIDSIVVRKVLEGIRTDTTTIWAKEEVTGIREDETGQTVYFFKWSEKKAMHHPWSEKWAGTMWRTDRQAFRSEQNLTFVKMVFPAQEGQQWNGNAYLDPSRTVEIAGETLELFKSWDYKITAVGIPFFLEGQTYPETLDLILADYETPFEIRSAREKYARGIGLVYRELIVADTQCQICCNGDNGKCLQWPWPVKAEKGFWIKQQLLDFK